MTVGDVGGRPVGGVAKDTATARCQTDVSVKFTSHVTQTVG